MDLQRWCRVLFYIWILFSVCGGAVAFSNKPFRQWTKHNNLTHQTWMICKCVMAWCRRRLLERMYTTSCPLIVGAPPQKKQTVAWQSTPELNLVAVEKKVQRFWHILWFLFITKWQNLLTVVAFRRFAKGPNFLIVLFFSNVLNILCRSSRIVFLLQAFFYSDWNGLSNILAPISDLRL